LDKDLPLERQLTVNTWRDRFFLNMPQPWGTGIHPERLLVVTLDRFLIDETRRPVKATYGDHHLLQLSVEINPIVEAEIKRIIENVDRVDQHLVPLMKLAGSTSQKALESMHEDLLIVRRAVTKALMS